MSAMWGMENGSRELLHKMQKDQCPECLGYNTTTIKAGADYVHDCNNCKHQWVEGWG